MWLAVNYAYILLDYDQGNRIEMHYTITCSFGLNEFAYKKNHQQILDWQFCSCSFLFNFFSLSFLLSIFNTSCFLFQNSFDFMIWARHLVIGDPLIDSTNLSVHNKHFRLSLRFVILYTCHCLFYILCLHY